MNFEHSARSRDYTKRVKQFIKDYVLPVEKQHWDEIHRQNHGGDWTKWQIPPRVEALKAKAKAERP